MKRGVWGIRGEEENAEYEGMVQPSQKHVARCVKGGEGRLDRRGLRMGSAFWAGIPVEVTQKAGVVPCCRRAAIGTTF